MSIPTSGFAALLVVATFALTSCGSDDGAATATAPATGSAAVRTVTQTATASAGTTTSAPQTTSASRTTSTPQPTTTSKPKPATATTKPAPAATHQASGGCGPVEVGLRDGDVDETYARITGHRNVDCQTITIVAGEWGRQQLGLDKALLPKGWECTKQNVCSGGSGRVSFVLERFG